MAFWETDERMKVTRETSRFLTSAQVAEILGVTKKTLKNWLRAGRIPEPDRNPRNRYRVWTLEEVEAIRQILREGK